jgi:hypothetical protein
MKHKIFSLLVALMLLVGIDVFANSGVNPTYSREKLAQIVTEYAVSNSNYNISDVNSIKIISEKLEKRKSDNSSNCVVIIIEAVIEAQVIIVIGDMEITFPVLIPITVIIEIGC